PDLTSRTVDVETVQTDDAVAQAIKTAGYDSTRV
ncbi:MAG: hypothetical protein ACI9IV_002482, partial [Paracoccaceae bacterium]